MTPFLGPLVLTVVLELVAAAALGIRRRHELLAVALVNLLTNPALNLALLALRALGMDSPEWIAGSLTAGEILVVLVEWQLLQGLLRDRTSLQVLQLSAILNLVSLLVGTPLLLLVERL